MLRTLFAVVAFSSALLLFQVQPMLGKRLLPWFGGSPATWTGCMLFFQLLLLAGYAWADALVRRAPQRLQWALQLALLAAAIALLPIGPSDADRPNMLDDAPLLQILSVLARTAGVPYLALACSAPLLQHWYERASGRSPYALYAFSNAGSMLGLLLYPFAIEPLLPMAQQARLWSALFVLFAIGFALCGWRAGRAPAPSIATGAAPPAPSTAVQARWFALALVPSVLLLAVTNHITVDVAAVPFLWVVPLALYLLSFVLAFAGERFCPRGLLLPLWVACTAVLGAGLFAHGTASLAQQLLVPLASLFVCALLCHGELARAQPSPAHLSRFYLLLAAGGAGGGVFVGVCAPLLFSGFFELQIAVIAAYAVMLWVLAREARDARKPAQLRWLWLGLGLGVPFMIASIWVQGQDRTRHGRVIEQRRSFYGVLSVIAIDAEGVTLLTHGRIRHGMQFQDPARALVPTLYFGPHSGAGRVLGAHAIEHPRRIGVVGLGAGTLAAYGRPGDSMRFYEISPDVVDAARRHFSFLRNSAAHVDIVVGDGRLALEREPAQGFDVLVLDAFSSDSVPAHLLTVEAFAIYARQLRADGVLLANVSNRHLDVERAVAGSAAQAGFALRIVETESDAARGYARARWALMARERAPLDRLLAGAAPTNLRGAPVTWRDDFSNLAQLLR